MADTSVKYFHSGMAGAPVLSGTAGAVIAILDACLVNGFGLKSVDSLVIAGNVATMNISGGHSGEVGAVVTVTGATPAGLNGEQKVTAAAAGSVSFATVGIADQTATGTIAMKLAPAGWAKQFTGTSKAAYKSTDVQATGCLLRVDDAAGLVSRIVGYEAMSDVDTGTGPFPTTTQRAGGSYWTKSNAAGAAARNWMLVADGRMFYFAREYNAANVNAYELSAFGDFLAMKSGDAYACVLSAQPSDQSASAVSSTDNYWYGTSVAAAELYVPRSYTGLSSAQAMRKYFPVMIGNSTAMISGQGVLPYPNQADGGLYAVPHYLGENASLALRGVSPGFYCSPQAIANGQVAPRDSINGVASLPGRTLKVITCANPGNGAAFFDITGPWR